MEKEFKKGDKVFYMETEQYGTFVDYSKRDDNDAVVNLFYGDNSEEATLVLLCFLKKVETKEVKEVEEKVHYEVFYKVYIDNSKTLERAKKEIFNIKEEREREHYVFLDRVKEIETIENNQIKKIIVKDENDYDIKTWDVGRANSILIGKKLHTNKVDVDLTNSIYSSLVSRVHGVLNRVEDIWYYEDLGSKNGSGIEKKSDRRKIKLKPNRAIKVESGDIIHIATTKILIK